MFTSLSESRESIGARKTTTVVSIGLHLSAVLMLALIPLIYTDALPVSGIRDTLISSPPPPPPAPGKRAVQIVSVQRIVTTAPSNVLALPTEIPKDIPRIDDSDPVPTATYEGGPDGVVGGMQGGVKGGVPFSPWKGTRSPESISPVPQPAAPTRPVRVRIGGDVQLANLVFAPKPAYPPLARMAHIQGSVVMNAIILRDGSVGGLVVKGGPPLLVQAAVDAVQQWRYRPTMLNGEAVEVITTITVNFALSGNQ